MDTWGGVQRTLETQIAASTLRADLPLEDTPNRLIVENQIIIMRALALILRRLAAKV